MQEGEVLADRSEVLANNGASAEARYRALFDSAGDAILIVNRQGFCIDANPRAIELLKFRLRGCAKYTLCTSC